jgi:hypothetical protein
MFGRSAALLLVILTTGCASLKPATRVTCTETPWHCYQQAEEICGPRWQQTNIDFNSTPGVYRMTVRC